MLYTIERWLQLLTALAGVTAILIPKFGFRRMGVHVRKCVLSV